jgi:hypothetical protein
MFQRIVIHIFLNKCILLSQVARESATLSVLGVELLAGTARHRHECSQMALQCALFTFRSQSRLLQFCTFAGVMLIAFKAVQIYKHY